MLGSIAKFLFTTKRGWGYVLAALGIAGTVGIAALGSGDEPLGARDSAIFTLLVLLAQGTGAWIFAADGKAQPALARSTVRRLHRAGARAKSTRLQAERLQASSPPPTPTILRAEVGQISVHLSYLEESLADAFEDWRSVVPSIVAEVEAASENGSTP